MKGTNKIVYLECTYDQWDEAEKKSSQKKKRIFPKYKQAKVYKNLYAR
jgi:hypothetical protein